MSKFEEFLSEISPLPQEIRRSLVLMRQLDIKKDGKQSSQVNSLEISNANNRIVK